MQRLKTMKENLISCVQGEMGHLKEVDSKELGEAIDMIKDLEEAIYYATITKAMDDSEHKSQHSYQQQPIMYFTERYPVEHYRDMDYGRRYYTPRNYENTRMYEDGMRMYDGSTGTRMYDGTTMNMTMARDAREGRSAMSRKSYLESKEKHQDKAVHLKELDHYMQELSHDIVEMIGSATPEEKTMLQQKLTTLVGKIK